MKIAIVDDEKHWRDHLISLIKSYHMAFFDIKEFCSGKEFLEADVEKYAIVFLDIEMPDVNGIETAKMVLARNTSTLIFYVTNYNTYISDALRLNTFQFLTKPINKEELYLDLSRALVEIQKKVKHIKLVWNGVEKWLLIKDIVYAESNNKKIKVIMKNGDEFYCSKKLSSLLEELKVFHFALCHKSFIVNLKLVETITTDKVELSNQKIIPISKRFRKGFKEAFNLFINEVSL